MSRARVVFACFLACIALLFTCAPALAQSGIAGVVKDTTGAVIPGVTVEASSPALIERVRSVVTDSEGQYKLVDLRPGAYSVTFSLVGFVTVKNDGIQLPSGFTATVNAELRVGGVQETLTVSGNASDVDVKTSELSSELSKSMLDVLPTGRSPYNFAVAVPGVTGVNLGGLSTGRIANSINAYGSSSYDSIMTIDGDRVNYNSLGVGGVFSTTRPNPAMIGEMNVVTTGAPAQYGVAGIVMNVIPREGGNQFAGYFYGMGTNSALDASNVTPALKAQNVGPVGVVHQWDVDPSVGGPLIKDRLWFYGSWRNSDIDQYRPGLYENATPGTFVYTNDYSRPSTATIKDPDESLRLTWQPTTKDKVKLFMSLQQREMNLGFELNTISNEATTVQHYLPNRILQAMWNRTQTSKLLFEAGWTRYDMTLMNYPQPGTSATNPHQIALTEQTTGLQFGAPQTFNHSGGGMWTYHGSASYVTGSHYVKVGGSLIQANAPVYGLASVPHDDLTYQLRNGVPNLLTEYAPVYGNSHIKADAALYAQDQWTIRRLTLNYGLRYEYFNGWNSAENEQGTNFVGLRSFPGTTNTPDWKDLNLRVAGAFDVFGDGKTAVRASLGRYDTQQSTGAVTQASPVTLSVQSATRTWNDTNDSPVPQCNLLDPNPNGQCGKLSNGFFGSNSPFVTTVDPALLNGFDVRPYQWEATASLQRQLIQGWSATVSFIRRSFSNFTVTKNLTVTPADYDPYCITAPVDPRLPGGGGNQICGLYDVKPQFFGIPAQSIVIAASKFGNETQVYHGFDLSTTARLARGIQLLGGVTDGRYVTNQCFIVNSPGDLRFCQVTQPFKPVFKMTAIFPIVWQVNGTVLVQSVPGGQNALGSAPLNTNNGIQANYVATNAQIAPSLGRNLSEGATATLTIPLIQPDTMYTPRQNFVSIRLTRTFQVQRMRIVPGVEVDNLFNSATAFSVNTVYGPAWLTPNQIMTPLAASFSLAMTF